MNGQIEKLIETAKFYVGYLEKKSNAQLEDFTANAGSGNWTIFGEWYNMNGAPWCAEFVSFCADKAGIPTSIIPKHASCGVGVAWFKQHNQWRAKIAYIPSAGDISYFTQDGVNPAHIGIVTGVDAGHVYTIEGNTGAGNTLIPNGGGVAAKSYPLSASWILGYGHPAYADADDAEIRHLVDAAAKKLGLTAPDYWYAVLMGTQPTTAEMLTALFKKIIA